MRSLDLLVESTAEQQRNPAIERCLRTAVIVRTNWTVAVSVGG
jgi:hypothetical protein